MNLALLEQIFQVLIQGVELGVQYAPQIIADLKQAYTWATTSDQITADQQAAVDAAMDAAHNALQAAGAAAEAKDAPVEPAT